MSVWRPAGVPGGQWTLRVPELAPRRHKEKLVHPRVCAFCGNDFLTSTQRLNRGNGKFCSIKCAGMAHRRPLYDGIIEDNSIPEPNSGCWLWTGAITGSGYGVIRAGDKFWLAHRLSYQMAYGEISESESVIRHQCDNPACVNPAHLIAGTTRDNGNDAFVRGRASRGSKRWNARLDEEDVAVIRLALKAGQSANSLAKAYTVNPRTIHFIRDRITWRHVP